MLNVEMKDKELAICVDSGFVKIKAQRSFIDFSGNDKHQIDSILKLAGVNHRSVEKDFVLCVRPEFFEKNNVLTLLGLVADALFHTDDILVYYSSPLRSLAFNLRERTAVLEKV